MVIKDKQYELVERIQEYSQDQVDIWKQIPYAALMKNGITGWSGTYATAYHMGLWRLESGQYTKIGGYYLTVDLETGKITNFNKPANTYHSIRLICQLDLDELDAQSILNNLQSDLEYKSYTQKEAILENHKRYNHIKPIYERIGPVKEPYYGIID